MEHQMKRNRFLRALRRSFMVVSGTVFMALFALVGVVYVILCGPSKSAQELLTRSLKETSAVGFIPDLFLPAERVEEIMSAGTGEIEAAEVDTSLVTISASRKESDGEEMDSKDGETSKGANGVEFVEITGASYRGILMIVEDPSRLFVGVPDTFGEKGLTLEAMIAKYDAAGGINGGGFYDPDGRGTGGTPDGIVITDGALIWGEEGTMSTVVGFDKEGILQAGYMSGRDALDRKLQWACSFGPVLVVNGESVSKDNNLASGVNPRTAIGQRADGAVLMLAVDGRQITSLGATLEDIIGIMLEQGAVNAVNLDGGSSTQMIYNDETLNVNASVRGPRALPTAFLVK